jgi:hypothetical protein
VALDKYSDCWNNVLLRCPSLSPKLAQDFVNNAFRRLAEVRRWSWLVKFGQFIAPQVTTGGTVNVTQNSTIVTGNGTAFTAAMVGQQFRVGLVAPIYTIATYDSPTQIELDSPFGGITQATVGYSIYQCFFPVPQDFNQFICLWDPAFNFQLVQDVQQSEINMMDAQRANTGNSYVVSFRGYTASQVGVVSNPVQITGTGAIPTSSGTFTAPINALYTIQITTLGQSGTAVFQWSKNNGVYTTGVVTDPGAAAQSIMDGITVAFPLGVTYNNGDQFIIQGTAISNPGVPLVELWPHQQSNHVFPFLYEARATDLQDFNAVLPRYIRGDVLVGLAMEEVAMWPGPSSDRPNIYFNLNNAEMYRRDNEKQVQLLEVADDNRWEQDLSYSYPQMAWAMCFPLGDSRFLQSHAI